MRALLIDHVGIGPSSLAEEVTLGDVEQAMQACGLHRVSLSQQVGLEGVPDPAAQG